ncbi:MAG: PilZ domain-containing protein, partial [Deltaproteobacteria bacterium]|nr:PilZ domain-containing protein [Deltaproteobacteria bacterium]
AAQAEAAQKAEAAKRAEAERLPAPLTSLAGRPESRAPQAAAALTPPVLRPAAPPAVASRAAWIPVQPVAPPVVARPPAWSNRPTPAELQAPPVRAAGLPQEARLSPRQRVQAEVTLSSESNFFTGFSGDLSEGGVFVATYEKLLEPDTPVEVALALPGRPAVKVPGRVRWVRDTADHAPGVFPGMGISFDKVAPEALAAIKSFLQQREPMFWDE